ncbi:MAG: hypothetical protein J6W35_08255 [Eubacterium sp.]|nr:hypothetical protein [Eubacterium sp.]
MSTKCLIGYAFGNTVYYACCLHNGYPGNMVPILRHIIDGDFLMERIINERVFGFLTTDCQPHTTHDCEPLWDKRKEEQKCSLEDFVSGDTFKDYDFRYLFDGAEWKCYGEGLGSQDDRYCSSDFIDMKNPSEDGGCWFHKESTTDRREFLVRRSGGHLDEGLCVNTIMTANELIDYVDMDDIHDESYEIYEITEYGTMREIFYRGWKPGCVIEFVDDYYQVVLRGYGTDH